MNLFYNNFKGYWVKAEIVCSGEGILKVSSAPASPIKIFIVHIQEKFREGLSNLQIDMMSGWTSIKYTLRVSLKISCQQSIYMVVISAKYSFISLFLHFN